MVKVGRPAPNFSLPSTSGKKVSLADFAGQKVVLYFYPRDDTPGCTTEACNFRDQHGRMKKAGAVVLGVSGDSLASHEKFRAKHELPFDLLVDEGNEVAKLYGAYGEKTLYGKKVVGTIRSTFVIDEQGKVVSAWSPAKVAGHADAVLAALGGPSGPKPRR
jgi:thioredoxin-dependent peroxiredoxin